MRLPTPVQIPVKYLEKGEFFSVWDVECSYCGALFENYCLTNPGCDPCHRTRSPWAHAGRNTDFNTMARVLMGRGVLKWIPVLERGKRSGFLGSCEVVEIDGHLIEVPSGFSFYLEKRYGILEVVKCFDSRELSKSRK